MMLCLAFGFLEPLPAQFQAPVRVEIPVLEDDSPFTLVPLEELGVLVVMRQNDLFSPEPERRLYFYDENLAKRWEAALPIESLYNYVGYRVEADSLRFVLTSLPGKSDLPSFLEVAVCKADGRFALRYHSVEVSRLHKASVESFAIADSAWYFLARNKGVYEYYRIDTRLDSARFMEVASDREYDCCDVQWDWARQEAYFLFRDAALKEQDLYLQIVGEDLQTAGRQVIGPPRSDMRLADAKLALLGNGKFLVGGAWNPESSRQHASTYDRGTETAGLFLLRCGEAGVEHAWQMQYLDFPNLDTLLSDEERYKIASSRQKAQGRRILPDYLCHLRFSPRQGCFHLLAETYDRILTTTTDVSYDFYGRMIPYTRTRFEGYEYKNAFYAVFDSLGENRGNSVFDIQHVRYQDDLPFVTAVTEDVSGNGLVYAYVSQGMVFYRGLDFDGRAAAVHSFRLSPSVPNDRVQQTWDEGLVFWYPGSFLSYGYQQVLNPRRKGKSRQNVFYMNKIAVDARSGR